MAIPFSSDELILTLISLVRAIDPRMLAQGPDGFTVDISALEKKPKLSDDEQLLMKLHSVLAGAEGQVNYSVELSAVEGQRLAGTLALLETMQKWPEDVLELSRAVRARLAGQP